MCFVTAAAGAGAIAGGATLATISTDIAIASAAVGVASAATQAEAQRGAARVNEDLAERRAKSAGVVGARRAGAVRRAAGRLAGSQRSALSATGFDPNRGDAVSIVRDTVRRGALDSATEILQARDIGVAASVDAENQRTRGRSARNVGAGRAAQTILGTGTQVAAAWYQLRR